MCRNGLDFERASGRVGEVSGVEWSVSQSIRCEKCPPKQSKAFIFLMYKKEKENKERIYISSPIYPMYYLLHKKISISNNMIP